MISLKKKKHYPDCLSFIWSSRSHSQILSGYISFSFIMKLTSIGDVYLFFFVINVKYCSEWAEALAHFCKWVKWRSKRLNEFTWIFCSYFIRILKTDCLKGNTLPYTVPGKTVYAPICNHKIFFGDWQFVFTLNPLCEWEWWLKESMDWL